MRDRRMVLLLIAVMGTIVVIVTGTTIHLLYTVAFEEQRKRLVEAAQKNARLIEGIVRTHPGLQQPLSPAQRNAALERVLAIYERFEFSGFGRTGNFMLGRRQGDYIVTLLHHRRHEMGVPEPVPFASGRAEPMRQALLGHSGALVGRDFAGRGVLAAYEPVPALGLGIVAKIAVSEGRAPFVRAGVIAAVVAVASVLLGAALFYRVTQPFLRRLRESEARSRQIVATAADGIVTMRPDGTVETLNPAAERMFGYTRGEIQGASINRLIPSLFPQSGPAADNASGAGTAWRVPCEASEEMHGRRRDGTQFPLEIALRAMHIAGALYYTGICRDITLRKEAEAQIMRAKEEAQRSDQAKTEFIAMVSHELRTPMSGVLGMNDLLLGTALDEEQRRYADAVRASGETLLNVINDVLDYSRIEAGLLELEEAPFALHRVLESVVDVCHVQAAARGLELMCDIAPDVPLGLRGDAARLKQVLFNLIDNACKFTDSGGVTVRVSPVERTGETILVSCEVRDTGIGIPPGSEAWLFERFTQADSSASRRYGGIGLGLAIARQITALMGGTIGYDRGPTAGSRFWFTARLEVLPAEEQPAMPDTASLAGQRILLADPLALTRELRAAQLRLRGLDVTEAADATAALARLGEAEAGGAPFALLLVAERPGELEAASLQERMRAAGQAETARVVRLAAPDGVTRPAGGRAASNAPHTLVKPVHLHALLEGLLRALDQAPAPGPGRTVAREARLPSGPALHILLAEDNPVNQLLAASYLKKMGHRVDVATNGEEALTAVRGGHYDLVLMDVHMPTMDGLQAAREIRALPGTAGRTPIVAVTADAVDDPRRYAAAGIDDTVTKPYDARTLAEVVRRCSTAGRPGPGRA